MPRIVSFLPAATEITYALGAGADLVGRSYECDYPPQVRLLPVVSKPALPLEGLSQREIDRAVAAHLATGESLYLVDEVLPVSYTHLRAHETRHDIVCRLLL